MEAFHSVVHFKNNFVGEVCILKNVYIKNATVFFSFCLSIKRDHMDRE